MEQQKPKKRKSRRKFYDPFATEPCQISHTKLELFKQCIRCFYIDRRLGVARPDSSGFPFNRAIDTLLKGEFDIYRTRQQIHPLCLKNGVDATPFNHTDLNKWRNTPAEGIEYLVPDINFLLRGGLDDIWQDNKTNELIVVEYKATAKKDSVSLDKKDGYKRQVEVYQWLLRRNGFVVSDTAYFVYCNGKTDRAAFNKQLRFNISILPYKGDDSWVEATIMEVYQCLRNDQLPASNPE